MIECIDRPGSHCCRMFHHIADLHHHRGLRRRSPMVLFFFDNHPKSQELKSWPVRPHGFSHEQFKGAFRRFKLVALTFTLLQGIDQFPHLGVALIQFDSVSLDLLQQSTPTCRIRDQHTLAIPYQPRDHMFIGRGILQHRMDMDPTLMGKG